MKEIIYSFIIPHRNSPELLLRCLASIPRRDDIQIIVVDDNSNPDILDWETFDIGDNKCVELVLTKEGRGAGYARNQGLKVAKGKWLLFADADDYYEQGFLDVLDPFIGSDFDVVYYDAHYKDVKGTIIKTKLNNYVKDASEGNISEDFVKYKINVPWNKMIRRQMVVDYKCEFEEIPKANDMFFSFQVGYFAKKIKILNLCLYNYIVNEKSQTNINWTDEKVYCFLENIYKQRGFFEFIGRKEWMHGWLYIVYESRKMGSPKLWLRILSCWKRNYRRLVGTSDKYVDILKERTIQIL